MSETALTTLSEVIDALGGPSAVAKLTGTKLPAVSNWQQFGRFPAKTYLVMSNALKLHGKVASSALWGMKEAAE